MIILIPMTVTDSPPTSKGQVYLRFFWMRTKCIFILTNDFGECLCTAGVVKLIHEIY